MNSNPGYTLNPAFYILNPMLDDLKYIHAKDTEDALGLAQKQWQQLEYEFDVKLETKNYQNIVHSGMGGTALWAMMAASWPGFKLPFEVVRGYDIPSYVGPDTLFIAASYSGGTEETLSAVQKAQAAGATIVVITSGGKLLQIAQDNNYPVFLLPKFDKPRFGTFYGFKALVTIGNQLQLLNNSDALDQLTSVTEMIKQSLSSWLPEVPTSQNQAKQLAQECMGRAVVVYSGPFLQPAAHKWKLAINENSHNLAWSNTFPEFNHNEFTGWTSHPTDKPYTVIYLSSSFDNERIKRRMELSDKLLSGRWPAPELVEVKGSTKAEQLLWSIVLGDFVSLYLALLNGKNPIDSGDKDIVDRFKKEMGDQITMADANEPPKFDPSNFSNEPYVKRVEKPWGYELHFAQEDLPYMIKVMHLNKGTRQSLQIHDKKQETYVLISGRGGAIWENSNGEMITTEFKPFVGYRTIIGQKHRLYAETDCEIMEGSTPEQGTTWRLEDDYARPNETPEQRRKERGE